MNWVTELTAADVAAVFVSMTDGIKWKEPEADGHFSRATEKLNIRLHAVAAENSRKYLDAVCACGHQRKKHAIDLVGDHFCEASEPVYCQCLNFKSASASV